MRKVPVLTLTEPITGHVDRRAEPPFVGVEVRDSSALRRAEDDARDRGSRFVEVPRDRGPVQARDAPLGTLPEPGHGGWSGRCHAFYNAEGTRFVRSRARVGLRAPHLRVELRRLSPIEHSVVAHDADAPEPRPLRQPRRLLERPGGGFVAKRLEQDDLSRCQDRVEDIPPHEPFCTGGESQPPRDVVRPCLRDPIRGPLAVDEHDRGSLARLRFVEPLLLQTLPGRKPRVARHLTHSQVVIAEDLGAALLLHGVMSGMGAPADQSLLVAPARERQDPAFPGEALIPDVIDETFDSLQLGAEQFCEAEIRVPPIVLRADFEQHGKHAVLLARLARQHDLRPRSWYHARVPGRRRSARHDSLTRSQHEGRCEGDGQRQDDAQAVPAQGSGGLRRYGRGGARHRQRAESRADHLALAEHLADERHLPRVRARLRQEGERHERRPPQDRGAARGCRGEAVRSARRSLPRHPRRRPRRARLPLRQEQRARALGLGTRIRDGPEHGPRLALPRRWQGASRGDLQEHQRGCGLDDLRAHADAAARLVQEADFKARGFQGAQVPDGRSLHRHLHAARRRGERAAGRRDRAGDGSRTARRRRVQQRLVRSRPRISGRVEGLHAAELPPVRRAVRGDLQSQAVRGAARGPQEDPLARDAGVVGGDVVEGDRPLLDRLQGDAGQAGGQVLQDPGRHLEKAARGLGGAGGEEVGREPAVQEGLRIAARLRPSGRPVAVRHQRRFPDGLQLLLQQEEELTPRGDLPMQKLLLTVDRISTWVGQLFAWLIVALTVLMTWEILSRRFFDAPHAWTFDAQIQLYGTLFMMAGAYTLSKSGHVRGDVLYGFFAPRIQASLDLALYLLFFLPGVVALAWAGLVYAQESWVIGERSSLMSDGPPIYTFKTVIPIAGALLLMQGLAEIVRCVVCLRDGHWPSRQEDVEEVDVDKLKEMVNVKDEDIAALDRYVDKGAKP